MDVQTLRFLCIATIIIVGLLVIPVGFFMYCHKRFNDRMKWWMLPTIILYLFLFFNYARDLVPNDWRLEAKEVYQCKWTTVYVEKTK